MIEEILKNKERVFNKNGESVNIDSVMIFDNGKVEQHFYHADDLHEMRSLSKVVLALAIGVAVEEKMMTLDTLVYPYIKDLAIIKEENVSKIKKWTIANLLEYSGGHIGMFLCKKDIKEKGLQEKDYLSYVLNYDIPYEAGEVSEYNNGDIFVLSVVFQKITSEKLSDFARRKIFEPLGIVNFVWEEYDGYTAGATGLYLTNQDLFKVGQMMLNKGVFAGKQIVPKWFVDEMCKSKIETPNAFKPERVLPKIANGFVMHISRDGYVFKDGTHGQYLILNFEKNLLITILSEEKDMSCVTEILRGVI